MNKTKQINQNSLSSEELQQQLQAMQMVIAHHEIMHQEMEKTALNLTQKLDDLQSRYQIIISLMQSMQEQQVKRPEDEVPPPHY